MAVIFSPTALLLVRYASLSAARTSSGSVASSSSSPPTPPLLLFGSSRLVEEAGPREGPSARPDERTPLRHTIRTPDHACTHTTPHHPTPRSRCCQRSPRTAAGAGAHCNESTILQFASQNLREQSERKAVPRTMAAPRQQGEGRLAGPVCFRSDLSECQSGSITHD